LKKTEKGLTLPGGYHAPDTLCLFPVILRELPYYLKWRKIND
jgi:hypothetical protein